MLMIYFVPYSSIEALRLRLGHDVAQPWHAAHLAQRPSPASICWASNAIGMNCFLPTRNQLHPRTHAARASSPASAACFI